MAEIQDLLVGEDGNVAQASGTAAATATQAAPGAGFQLFITGFSISHGLAPTAAGTLQIRQNGGATIRKRFLLPAAGTYLPEVIEFKRPIKVPENQDADIIAAGWTTATVQVELYTITRRV